MRLPPPAPSQRLFSLRLEMCWKFLSPIPPKRGLRVALPPLLTPGTGKTHGETPPTPSLGEVPRTSPPASQQPPSRTRDRKKRGCRRPLSPGISPHIPFGVPPTLSLRAAPCHAWPRRGGSRDGMCGRREWELLFHPHPPVGTALVYRVFPLLRLKYKTTFVFIAYSRVLQGWGGEGGGGEGVCVCGIYTMIFICHPVCKLNQGNLAPFAKIRL